MLEKFCFVEENNSKISRFFFVN
ncbi:unnamed protein product [Victoria cruziana]